eukprot:181842_1
MNASVALVLTITCIIIVCLLLWSDSNIKEITLNQKEDAIKMLSQNQSIYSVLFTTPRLRKQFDFHSNKYLDFIKLNEEYLYQRSLSVYPGNNGALLNLLFTTFVNRTANDKCLRIAVTGGSVTLGIKNMAPNTTKVDKTKRFSNYLQIFLNEHQLFRSYSCKHTVHNLAHSGHNAAAIIKSGVFIKEFVNIDKDKYYDIIIMETATNTVSKRNNILNLLKEFEMYYRNFMSLKYNPVLINIELTHIPYNLIFKDNNDRFPGAFGQISILKYYQIPSISLYDSILILSNEY